MARPHKHKVPQKPNACSQKGSKTLLSCRVCPTTVYKRLQDLKNKFFSFVPPPAHEVAKSVTFHFDLLQWVLIRGWMDSRTWKVLGRTFKISGRIFETSDTTETAFPQKKKKKSKKQKKKEKKKRKKNKRKSVTFLFHLLMWVLNRGWADSKTWKILVRTFKISDRMF